MDSNGFVRIPGTCVLRAIDNVERHRNEVSPFSDVSQIPETSATTWLIDSYWGQVYDDVPLQPYAIYGKTEDLPPFSGDELEDLGYLRVPFRRIPRRMVKSSAELESFVAGVRSADPDLELLFRGQPQEYYLKRTPAANLFLYGEESVREPSLLTSASRRSNPLERVLPEWCALLQFFFLKHYCDVEDFAPPNQLREYMESRQNCCEGRGLWLFALSLAQHYGLPSSGLDVTDRLDVATFFALMQYQVIGPSISVYKRVSDESMLPVIYLMSTYRRQQLNYDMYRPKGFPVGRPDRQHARFLHTSWGFNRNDCARRIFFALYLDPKGDFCIPSVSELFPSEDQDRFGKFLADVKTAPLPAGLRKTLDDYRSVMGN